MNLLNDNLIARALKAASNPVFIVDIGTHIVWANDAYLNLIGVSKENVIGRVPPSLQAMAKNKIGYAQMLSSVFSGETWVGELTETSSSLDVRIMEAVFTPLQDAKGNAAFFLVLEHDITARKAEMEKVWHIAHHDNLTGLANKSLYKNLLDHSLRQAKRSEKKLAVFFLDLDKFKAANDTFGHHVGDLVLVEVGLILRRIMRESDVIARFGGDEFGLILPNVESLSSAETVAQNIVDAICKPMQLDNKVVNIGASIGISLFPNDGIEIDVLVRSADTAMYAAKKAGRNCFRSFGCLPKANIETGEVLV